MKVLIFPKDDNPYQTLLYLNMEQSLIVAYLDVTSDSKIKTITYLPRLLFGLSVWRLRGFRIIHIHWLYKFSLPSKIPFSGQIAFVNTLLFLHAVKILRYKVVWTAHNVLPHERITSNDLYIRKRLGTITGAIITHSPATVPKLEKLGIKSNAIHIVPHGTYQGTYPDSLSRDRARDILGIGYEEFVFLFFGRIRTYKNVSELIETFKKLVKTQKNISMIIAGNTSDEALRETIEKGKLEIGKKLITRISYIPDDEVQHYFKAADIAVYPFKEISTSGSVIAALSFGLPIIVPMLGALRDLPNDVGYFYEPIDKNGLSKAMMQAVQDKGLVSIKGKKAKHYAESLSWDEISVQTYNIYEKLLEIPKSVNI